MNELEARVVATLRAEAARAPIATPEWPGRTYANSPAPRRRPTILLVAAAAAAAAVLGGALAARSRSQPGNGSGTAPAEPWRTGDEYRLELRADGFAPGSLAKPGSLQTFATPGGAPILTAYTVAMYEPTGVTIGKCYEQAVQGTCGVPTNSASNANWASGAAAQVIYVLAPDTAAYAAYRDGDVRAWQRIASNVAIFPAALGSNPTVTLYDRAGHIVAHLSRSEAESTLPPDDGLGRRLGKVPGEWRNAAGDTFRDTLRDCIGQHGAAFPQTNLPVLPPGADDDAVWTACVSTAKEAADRRFVELGGTLPIP